MQSRCWLVIILVFLLMGNGIPQDEPGSALGAKLDAFMNKVTQNGYSGSVLVAKDGRVIMSKGYGLADRERHLPVTSQTVFTIGSITKQFTAAAILKLQMQEKLSVDDKITKYFKNVPEDKKGITLHHLLTHAAGFPGAIGDDFAPITRDEFINLAMNTKLLHPPGEKYRYSNVGYSLLGAIVEIVTGMSFEAFLNDNLFTPAGMMKTGYRIPGWNPDELAHGYRGERDWGTLLDKAWAEDGPYWHLRANGGILSTVEDMYRWHMALESDRILTDEAKKAAYTPHIREGEDAESYYGYGWAIFTTPRKTRLIAHNGGNTIFAADFLRYLDEGVVIIGLSNIAGKPAWRVTSQLARIVFGYDFVVPFGEDDAPPLEGQPSDFPDDDEQALLAKKWSLPNSNTGRRGAQLLDVIDSMDESSVQKFLEQNLAPDFLEAFSMEEHLSQFRRMHEDIGRLELINAVKTGQNSARFEVRSIKRGQVFHITITLEEKEPYRIIVLSVETEDAFLL